MIIFCGYRTKFQGRGNIENNIYGFLTYVFNDIYSCATARDLHTITHLFQFYLEKKTEYFEFKDITI